MYEYTFSVNDNERSIYKYFITITRKITQSTNTLFLQVGPSCLAGLLVLGFLLPFNALYLGRKAMKLQVDF